MQRAITDSGELSTGLWRLLGHALRPLFRIVGGRQRVWPPSRESAPLLVLGWVALSSPLYFLLRQRKSRDIQAVEKRRREHALSSLATVIANEDLRLRAGGGPTKVPPSAERLFALLFDEIEHQCITAIGVSSSDELFTRGMGLLRTHTSRELREAIDKTRQAREAADASTLPVGVQQFADGRTMRRLMRFVANQVLPGMRDQLSPEQRAELRALVKEAARFSQAMQSENRRAMVSQRHLPPLFPGHFSPVLRRLFAVLLLFPASWRQDGENGRKMA